MHSKRDIAKVAAGMPDRSALSTSSPTRTSRIPRRSSRRWTRAGWAFPTATITSRPTRKSVELRQAYVAHVQKMFELLGDAPSVAATEAQTVLRIETALAKGSLTQVERRDPKLLYHKMTREELETLSPSFRWKEYFSLAGQPGLQSLNVTAPEFFKTMDATLKKEDLESWKAYLRWHLVNANAPYLSSAFVNANFDFFGKTLSGSPGA